MIVRVMRRIVHALMDLCRAHDWFHIRLRCKPQYQGLREPSDSILRRHRCVAPRSVALRRAGLIVLLVAERAAHDRRSSAWSLFELVAATPPRSERARALRHHCSIARGVRSRPSPSERSADGAWIRGGAVIWQLVQSPSPSARPGRLRAAADRVVLAVAVAGRARGFCVTPARRVSARARRRGS